MKLRILSIFVIIPAMNASPVTCNAGAASIPVFDPSSTSGVVGDYTLDCTGGIPVAPPLPVPEIDVTTFMNVSVLNTGGWILKEGAQSTPGTLVADNEVAFDGVPFNPPGTGTLDLEIENILVNPSAEPPGFEFMELAQVESSFSIDIMNAQQEVAVNAVPEPSMLLFVGLGLGAMLGARYRPPMTTPRLARKH